MSNTLTLDEPLVDSLLPVWTGLEVWHAVGPAGPFTFLGIVPYVAGQTQYTYTDAAGLSTDWYQVRRYGPGPTYGAFSAAWPVSPAGSPGVTLALIEQTV